MESLERSSQDGRRRDEGDGMAGVGGTARVEDFVYRVSTAKEWDELRRTGATLGGEMDRSTGCIHLSSLHQVKMVLENYFRGASDLFLLRIDTAKLGHGLVYEAAEKNIFFPHFYGPSRSFMALSLDCVSEVEKLEPGHGHHFSCSMLDNGE